MYPSRNNSTHNPISFSGQNIQQRPLFISDINPNSKFEDPHLTSLYHLPSPYIEYEDAVNNLTWQQLHDLFIQLQPLTGENSVAEIVNPLEDQNKDPVDGLMQDWNRKCESMAEKVTRNRPSKKDRHSKINTAHGLRDRRMRLSLDVARKFFDLQDILGFDKASKTVEWLLIQSSSAIKEIMRGLPQMRHSGANTTASSTSECEVVSGIDDSIPDNTNYKKQESISVKMKVKSSCKKEKAAKLARRNALHSLARESRKVARERARKRTIEKRRLGDQSKLCLEARNADINQLGCWGTHFETVEESGTQDHKLNPSYEGLTEVEELDSQERRLLVNKEYGYGDILAITSNWNPSSIFNNHQISEISHEPQFSDFQF